MGIVTAVRTVNTINFIFPIRRSNQMQMKRNQSFYPHSTFCIFVHSSVSTCLLCACACSQARYSISILLFCSCRKLKSTPITRYSARMVGNTAIAANTFAIIPHTHTQCHVASFGNRTRTTNKIESRKKIQFKLRIVPEIHTEKKKKKIKFPSISLQRFFLSFFLSIWRVSQFLATTHEKHGSFLFSTVRECIKTSSLRWPYTFLRPRNDQTNVETESFASS